MKNILWTTGFNLEYYNRTFTHVKDTWEKLPGDVLFLVDENIPELSEDKRLKQIDIHFSKCPKGLNDLELKFWKKSRTITYSLKLAKELGYDYFIWLDADVEVLANPCMTNLLPCNNELFSGNSKMKKRKVKGCKGTSLDTGFVAFNINHYDLDRFIDIYEKFWRSEKFDQLPYRYDTCVLEQIVEDNNYEWKNLWSGEITKGRSFCGFEDSELDLYFFHYWGGGQKKSLL